MFRRGWICDRPTSRASVSLDAESRVPWEYNVNGKITFMLWIAGLRGAMSLALVEEIPLYDFATGDGTKFKPQLKAMTSASILFTIYVFGGGTKYAIERLGIGQESMSTVYMADESIGLQEDEERIRTPTSSQPLLSSN